LQRFLVMQEHEDLWWVRHNETNLYSYATEEEARAAALALANHATRSGAAATVVIVPPKTDLRVELEFTQAKRRFTGM
jgi:triosephosphate isomerase